MSDFSVDTLETRLCVLQSHLDDVIDCIRQNDLKSKRFQALEMTFLSLNSLRELVEHVLADTRREFDLDVVSFALVDEKNELRQFLREDGLFVDQSEGISLLAGPQELQSVFGKLPRLYLGEFKPERHGRLLDSADVSKPLSVVMLPLQRRHRFLGCLCMGSHDSSRFHEGMATDFLARLSTVLSVCLENTLNFEYLRRTSLFDTLTGVNNRRFFEQRIGEEIDRALRSGEPLSCLFLDIDYFKSVNDTYGHQAGDQVLAETASSIRSQLRNNDVLARYGGEEFVALLTGANEQRAMEAAERIRSCIARQGFPTKEGAIMKVTISIGVVALEPSRVDGPGYVEPRHLIELADMALYQAKNSGRNRVVSAGLVSIQPRMPTKQAVGQS